MAPAKKWGREDDAKLFALFRQPNNGLDPNKQDVKSVKYANDRFFPEREYKNFGPLYRKKCSEFITASELDGSRKRKADGTEEDESLEEDDFEDTDELLDEEDDVEMPPKKTAAAAKKAPDTDADTKLSAGVKAMSISKAPKYQPYSMSFSFPFMIKEFIHDNRKSCTVDILVPTVAEDRVRPVVSTDLEYLLVSIVVPEFSPEYQRIEASNFGDDTFHGNTSVATAHHKVIVQSIRTAFNGQPEVIGEPMKIKLPFKVEESIAHWELQLFNGDAEVSAAAGDQQYFSMLKVDLISIERVFRRVTGGMRVVGSPNAADHRAAAAAAGGGP